MSTKPASAQGLSIGDLADRTGVSPAVLRAWEARHGFPVAHRLPSGHRRYDAEAVASVAQVVRRQRAGIRLDAAIAEVRGRQGPAAPSIFATLRDRHPHLERPQLRKATLLALSHAIEDEFCARAESPVLFGAFQTPARYRGSAARWEELARTARAAVVLADFPAGGGSPVRVPLDEASPMRREWAVVCDSADLTACLSAWELPGQRDVPDHRRMFEAIWTVEPVAVRDAARVCAGVTRSSGVEVAGLEEALDTPVAVTPDLRGVTALFTRALGYVDRR
ncbi:MAG TPA: DICT sensory domain-containing protein [Marmoricola sp.]